MSHRLKILDMAVRGFALVILTIIAFPTLAILCIMGTDSGERDAIALSETIFVIGTLFLCLLAAVALAPDAIARKLSKTGQWSRIVVRAPAYLTALGGVLYVFRCTIFS